MVFACACRIKLRERELQADLVHQGAERLKQVLEGTTAD